MNEKRYKHPSYGTVGFHRQSSTGKLTLFGSSVRRHMTTIALTIREADRSHDLHQDRIFGSNEIIEVEMSAAQFAELLTTMNVGTGVPCTIRRRNGKIVDDPPDDEIEIDRVQDSFKDGVAALRKSVKKSQEIITKILEKKSVNKGDKESIRSAICMIRQEIESNWSFAINQFNEATERVVTAAKSEVDSFVTHVVQKTGLAQLKNMMVLNGNNVIEHKALNSSTKELTNE